MFCLPKHKKKSLQKLIPLDQQFSVQQVFALCNLDNFIIWNFLILEVFKVCKMKNSLEFLSCFSPYSTQLPILSVNMNSNMGVNINVNMDVSMDIAMANMNISPNNSVAVHKKGFKRSPQMKRTNWYQNQGPRKLQKESRVCMRAN